MSSPHSSKVDEVSCSPSLLPLEFNSHGWSHGDGVWYVYQKKLVTRGSGAPMNWGYPVVSYPSIFVFCTNKKIKNHEAYGGCKNSPVENGGKHPTLCRLSTILSVVRGFATIHRHVQTTWANSQEKWALQAAVGQIVPFSPWKYQFILKGWIYSLVC